MPSYLLFYKNGLATSRSIRKLSRFSPPQLRDQHIRVRELLFSSILEERLDQLYEVEMASGSPIPSHVAVLEDFKTLKRVADRLHTMPLLQQHYESHIAGIRVTNPDVDELLEAFDRMVPVAAVELTFQGQPKLQMPRAVGIKFLAFETGYHLVDHFANIWLKSVGVPHFRGRKDQSGRLDMDAYSIMTKETFADLIAYPLTSIIAMSIPAIAPGVILTAETAHVSFLSEFRRVLGQQRARDVEYKFNLDNSTMLDLEAFHNEYLRFCSFIFQRARDSIAKGGKILVYPYYGNFNVMQKKQSILRIGLTNIINPVGKMVGPSCDTASNPDMQLKCSKRRVKQVPVALVLFPAPKSDPLPQTNLQSLAHPPLARSTELKLVIPGYNLADMRRCLLHEVLRSQSVRITIRYVTLATSWTSLKV